MLSSTDRAEEETASGLYPLVTTLGWPLNLFVLLMLDNTSTTTPNVSSLHRICFSLVYTTEYESVSVIALFSVSVCTIVSSTFGNRSHCLTYRAKIEILTKISTNIHLVAEHVIFKKFWILGELRPLFLISASVPIEHACMSNGMSICLLACLIAHLPTHYYKFGSDH